MLNEFEKILLLFSKSFDDATCIALGKASMPIHFLPNCSTASKVVPEPQKKSKTILSWLEEAKIIYKHETNHQGSFFDSHNLYLI